MSVKLRNILLICFMSLVTISLFTVSLTLGRYSEERGSDGVYSDRIDYIISNQVEIQSVDEFFNAIENGYNNIKIKDEVDNPLVISGGISDVNSDLIIDLNGHELQRNNREPLLNVTQGIRLTVIDTSEKQTGSFYNPVGSVLRVSGGTLTVSSGIFESGVRSGAGKNASEYYGSGSGGMTTAQGARLENSTVDKIFVKRGNGYTEQSGSAMPVIVPGVKTLENGNFSVNGNIYFPTAYGGVKADTYLYFTLDDETVENSLIVTEGSAQQYYSYYLERSDGGIYTYDPDMQEQTESNVLITIYVYESVEGTASDESSSYAAVEMDGGNLYVRGGEFHSYFGVKSTYCVNASGGYMAIESGSFNAYGRGVCIACDYGTNTDTEKQYLRVTNGSFYSELGNTIDVSGGRMVVTDAEFVKNATGYAMDGTRRNANGSAIYVTGGSLSVSASSQIDFSLYGSGMSGITADGANASVSVRNVEMDFYSSTDGADKTSPNGIVYNTGIYALGGKVICNGSTEFNVLGSYSSGIYSNGGQITINGDSFTCNVNMDENGENGNVLSSTAISAVGGSIDFNVDRADITSNGLGLTVGGGDINFKHNGNGSIFITTERGTAIYVYDGSITVSENSTLDISSTIKDNCSWAPDSSNGTGASGTGVNINNGVYINGGSFVSYGAIKVRHTGVANSGNSDSKIKSYAVRVDGRLSTANSKFDAASVDIETYANGGGLYVNQGSISIGNAEITTQGFGIAMRGTADDTVTIDKKLTLTSEKATGIYITGGSLDLNEGSVADVTSAIDADYAFCDTESAVSYDGVYVYGGSLIAKGTFNVTHKGLSNDYQTGDGDELYRTFIYKSYAIRIEGDASGSSAGVIIHRGNIVNSSGGGAYVNGGSVELGSENGADTDIVIRTTGKELFDGGYVRFTGAADNWDYRLTSTGGPALNVSGGSLTVLNGTFSAAQGNGIVVQNGTANVYGGVFSGNDTYAASSTGAVAGPAASYGFAVYGGTANVYGGTFNEGSQGSGAFVTGVDGLEATANIYGGTFNVLGQAGFSVYEYAAVLFDPHGGANGAGSDILVKGDAAGLTIEINNTEGVDVTINGGRFESIRNTNGDGIWCGDDRTNLTITGGEFVGSSRSGLRIDSVGASSLNVELSGGTFVRGIGPDNGYLTSLLAPGYEYSHSGSTVTVVSV